MKIFFSLIAFFLFLNVDAFACKLGHEKINKFFEARKGAFNRAKFDAKIPKATHPYKVEHVPLLDGGKEVVKDGKRVMTRQYFFKNTDGADIVIQEHTFGHSLGTREAGQMPHFNVRPIENINTGKVPGTAGHYNIGPEVGI